jgi:hypothetical protein
MARVTIKGDSSKVMPATIGGNPHPALEAWFDFAKGQKSVVATTDAGMSAIEIDSDTITMQPLLLALSQGFTVDDAPVFIKMSTATYAANVPMGISNRADEQGAVRKWSEWKDATHEHMNAADGDKIVPGNSWGVELTSNELAILASGGYSLYLAHEVGALMEA